MRKGEKSTKVKEWWVQGRRKTRRELWKPKLSGETVLNAAEK